MVLLLKLHRHHHHRRRALMLHNVPLMRTSHSTTCSSTSRAVLSPLPSPPSAPCREEVAEGPLAPPLLQPEKVWQQHCGVITAKSRWWKTLVPLQQAISTNIYAAAAGFKRRAFIPAFVQRNWGEVRKNPTQIAGSQMWQTGGAAAQGGGRHNPWNHVTKPPWVWVHNMECKKHDTFL